MCIKKKGGKNHGWTERNKWIRLHMWDFIQSLVNVVCEYITGTWPIAKPWHCVTIKQGIFFFDLVLIWR